MLDKLDRSPVYVAQTYGSDCNVHCGYDYEENELFILIYNQTYHPQARDLELS